MVDVLVAELLLELLDLGPLLLRKLALLDFRREMVEPPKGRERSNGAQYDKTDTRPTNIGFVKQVDPEQPTEPPLASHEK